jgi:hypothetical protein
MVGKPHLTLGEGIPVIRQGPCEGPEKPCHKPTNEMVRRLIPQP